MTYLCKGQSPRTVSLVISSPNVIDIAIDRAVNRPSGRAEPMRRKRERTLFRTASMGRASAYLRTERGNYLRRDCSGRAGPETPQAEPPESTLSKPGPAGPDGYADGHRLRQCVHAHSESGERDDQAHPEVSGCYPLRASAGLPSTSPSVTPGQPLSARQRALPRTLRSAPYHDDPAPTLQVRLIDGSGTHVSNPGYGSAGTHLIRLAPPAYADGIAAPPYLGLPNPRSVSNLVAAQTESAPNSRGVTDMFWQWGQFVDHDIGLTPEQDPKEPLPIPVPKGDRFFDPKQTGDKTIKFSRSEFDPKTGRSYGKPRKQVNAITAFIDASQIYGSNPERAYALRPTTSTVPTCILAATFAPMSRWDCWRSTRCSFENTTGWPTRLEPPILI